MSTEQGRCPKCNADNSYTALVCGTCGVKQLKHVDEVINVLRIELAEHESGHDTELLLATDVEEIAERVVEIENRKAA